MNRVNLFIAKPELKMLRENLPRHLISAGFEVPVSLTSAVEEGKSGEPETEAAGGTCG